MGQRHSSTPKNKDALPVKKHPSPFHVTRYIDEEAVANLFLREDSSSYPSFHTLGPLPVELLLHCFAFMSLRALIVSRGVSMEWRRLVGVANVIPARRRLLHLYDTFINSRYFFYTRQWTLDNVKPFDRRGYIDALLRQHSYIPPDFYFYILEWPERVVVDCWPGLPFVDCPTKTIQRRDGINFLAKTPPQLSTLIHTNDEWPNPKVELVPALLTWRTSHGSEWLIFDERPDLLGRVFVAYCDDGDVIDIGNDDGMLYDDWAAVRREWWNRWGGSTHSPFLGDYGPSTVGPDHVLPVKPTNDNFLNNSRHDVPAPPWNRRQEPQFQQRLFTIWQ
ncbi:hypothetical protein NLJ89_g2978 [Agrocybe chaxingu]|uniref:F-box domain-containing protein n=1 Tax=Agrocybe chaxingu TaxID=84603 RepID=A0A9W8MYI4_9AGAR|nr:hypothetical protein NLJ89_g2978 [Agrocybe chaxingu]